MHRVRIKRIVLLLATLAMTGCAATGPGHPPLKRLDSQGACQEDDGTVWSHTSNLPVQSWQEAAAFVSTLNSAHYLGHDDWRLPLAADLDRLHGYRDRKQNGDCEVPVQIFLFVADESRPLRYESGLVGCGMDSKKEVNQTGIGHVRAIRGPR